MQIVTIPGCRDWLAVTKVLKYNKFGCIEATTYSDWGLGEGWVEWVCLEDTPFKFIMCAPNGDKVLVISSTDPNNPSQVINTYINVITGLERTGNPTTLERCIGEAWDIQTKQYCDEGTTIFGTLIFDVSSESLPTLVGIVYSELDGSVHTPINPVEGACSVNSNDNGLLEITDVFVLNAGEYQSVSITVTTGTATVEIGANTANLIQGVTIVYAANTLLENAITITPSETVLLTRIK